MKVKVGDTEYDNGGNGFVVSDKVVFQQRDSCYDANSKTVTVYGAVSSSISSPNVTLEVYDRRPRVGAIIPGLYKESATMQKSNDYRIDGYDLYKGTFTYTTYEGGEFSVAAYSNGQRYADDFKMTSLFNGTDCSTNRN
ncbi:hypothetical protein AX15_007583 [Amanita polypyramis BW_CC]|nr:hypothetical protein AX15_007583 [Amanita polypyramis BW_CC]